MAVMTILVIDDDPNLRSLATDALGDEGYCVVAVESTAAGLTALRGLVFDLILLDHSTSGDMTDEQFIAQAHQLPHGAPPILLWTAWSPVDEQATAMGADGVLEKPISLDALFARIRQAIGEPEDDGPPHVAWPIAADTMTVMRTTRSSVGGEGASMVARVLGSSRGQGLVEYALIIFLVAVAAMVVLGTLGGKIKLVFTSVTGGL